MKKKKQEVPSTQQVTETAPLPVKLDIGCGPNKIGPEWIGVDAIKFDKVDVQLDINTPIWPWEDNSVDEVHCSHFVEHLDSTERVHFVNELYRVLKPGAKATIITPHWSSCRAYGDLTHKWPPVSEFWFYYLDKNWRAANAPHGDIQFNPAGYSCNFQATWGYSLRQDILVKNQEQQMYAMNNFKDVCQDTIASLIKA